MRIQTARLAVHTFFLTALAGCVDPVEPAGSAQYENPDYPSELMGYAAVSSEFTGAFDYLGRIYVMNDETELIESFSLDDPYLDMSSIPVEKDTLLLGFKPGAFCLERATGTLYLENRENYGVYRVVLPDGAPELIRESQSIITSLDLLDGSIIISYLGPDWLARRIDAVTGETQGEFHTGWPVTRTFLSPEENRLVLSNSSKEFLLNVNPFTMELIDTLHLPERTGPFLVNSQGNTVVFNQNSIHPSAYLFSGETGEEMNKITTVNSYRSCSLIPGTDIVIAPRRSENRISVLNTGNMIFAPSISCIQHAEIVFSTCDGEYIIVLTDVPGRVYVYSHQ